MNEIEEVDEYQEPTVTSCPNCGKQMSYLNFSEADGYLCDGIDRKCRVPVVRFIQEFHSKGK